MDKLNIDFVLPCWPIYGAGQVRDRIDKLWQIAADYKLIERGSRIGLDVFFPGGMVTSQKEWKRVFSETISILEQAGLEGMMLPVVDCNGSFDHFDPNLDYSQQGSENALKRLIEASLFFVQNAEKMGMIQTTPNINIHLSTTRMARDWKPEWDTIDYKKEILYSALNRILNTINETGFPGTITIETMPLPKMGDQIEDPKDMAYDILFTTLQDHLLFPEDYSDQIKIGVDTSHTGNAIATINRLHDIAQRRSTIITKEYLESHGFKGIDPNTPRQPGLVELMETLGSRIGPYFQVSDFSGLWIPNRTLFKEGTQILQGGLGWSLIEAMNYIAQNASSNSKRSIVSLDTLTSANSIFCLEVAIQPPYTDAKEMREAADIIIPELTNSY